MKDCYFYKKVKLQALVLLLTVNTCTTLVSLIRTLDMSLCAENYKRFLNPLMQNIPKWPGRL